MGHKQVCCQPWAKSNKIKWFQMKSKTKFGQWRMTNFVKGLNKIYQNYCCILTFYDPTSQDWQIEMTPQTPKSHPKKKCNPQFFDEVSFGPFTICALSQHQQYLILWTFEFELVRWKKRFISKCDVRHG